MTRCFGISTRSTERIGFGARAVGTKPPTTHGRHTAVSPAKNRQKSAPIAAKAYPMVRGACMEFTSPRMEDSLIRALFCAASAEKKGAHPVV